MQGTHNKNTFRQVWGGNFLGNLKDIFRVPNDGRSVDFGTPGSMNSLFSDLFMEFWRGILGGVRDYLGEVWGGF